MHSLQARTGARSIAFTKKLRENRSDAGNILCVPLEAFESFLTQRRGSTASRLFRVSAVTIALSFCLQTEARASILSPMTDMRAVQAQSIKKMSLEELGNVEVTAQSKEPEQVWETPAAVSVLTQQDIRRLGATNIPDLLRMLPGVFVGTVNSEAWAVGVRGFASNFSKSLLVLIDGRNVYTPLFGGVYWQVQDLVFEDIDRIEVIRGPGGVVWGENAVNGVINIITKKSKDTHGALSTTVAGNLEHYNGEAQYGGAVGKDFNYRIFAKGFLRGPEIHPNANVYDAWHMARGGFRTDWTPNQRDQLMVQ
jgi:iron complex outermembrane recepter protein